MPAFAIVCEIAPDALAALKAHRLAHLRYIRDHAAMIRFGGPTRDAAGMPERMIIIVDTPDPATADAFIAAEPYNRSGAVFASVVVRPWSQVMPEPYPGALDAEIAKEAAA